MATLRELETTLSNQDGKYDPDLDGPREADDPDRNKRESRMMWIFSLAIVLLILGGMGAHMLFSHDQAATDISSQSRTAPEK